MIELHNISVYDICWLNHAKGGMIGTFYEPENLEEFVSICTKLYRECKKFDLIGHTSNIYFLPNYNTEFMVSTRKCNHYSEKDDCIVCDCGTPVAKLARAMLEKGVKGFEGLIDLPGTVAAAVYGNASCFECSINSLLISCELLKPDGAITTISRGDLRLSKRSTALKRGELGGAILSIKLRKELGNAAALKEKAVLNHQTRQKKQPGPKDNLGSIYGEEGGWTLYGLMARSIAKCYGVFIRVLGTDRVTAKNMQKVFFYYLIGGKDLMPYVYHWNRYIWKDEQSHDLFWKFHRLHGRLFKKSIFEIEIKGERND